ncbi:LOW QUALITY PROTEIN: Homeotic protein female sterile [Gryllus bimaculatus]|nr:LOW QUALITY PROTEIN: Homeotic protein female sterile [Gryllus bimaculatus]
MGGSRGLSTSTPTPGTSPASALASLGSLSAGIGAATTPGITDPRRKPGSKPRRVIQSPSPVTVLGNSAPTATIGASVSPSPTGSPSAPLGSLATSIPAAPSASLAQLFAAADAPRPASRSGTLPAVTTPTPADTDSESPPKDSSHRDSGSRSSSAEGRPRNLGRGVSKPKKNTVASLLAQSRALGIKPTLDATSDRDREPAEATEATASVTSSEEGERASTPARVSTPTPTSMIGGSIPAPLTPTLNTTEDKEAKKRPLDGTKTEDTSGQSSRQRTGDGVSEDSSAGPDVSSDSCSASEAFPSDSEEDGEDGIEGGKQDGEEGGPATKRRRLEQDEKELRIPLEQGWRRETVISGVSRTGVVRGEVTYFSPDGRRFKQYHEILRFLWKQNVTDLTRDNFSFSSKVLLGDFLQPASSPTEEPLRLSEEQVLRRLEEIRAALGSGSRQRHSSAAKIEQARLAQEHRLAQQAEREKAAQAAKEAKRLAKEEAARQKEQVRLLKEQERCERQEAVRREREQRNLQMMEGRKRLAFSLEQKMHIIREIERGQSKSDVSRKLGFARSTVATIWKHRAGVLSACRQNGITIPDDADSEVIHASARQQQRQQQLQRQQKEAASARNFTGSDRNASLLLEAATERELKRQQAVLIKEQERERRRQHMMLVKALEARKRMEERERRRQEARAEKEASRERRAQQRRLELELVREMRKPAEDMELTDHKPLPTLNRIPGLKLSGQAFADTLMVFEFLHNFGETLGFDMESLPSLNSLQMALLNDEEAEEELLSVMTHLLVCAIEDPGIPNPARHTTLLGQSLKQADITHANISEILRIYLYANATGEVKALTGLHFERDREKKSDHHNSFSSDTNNASGKDGACTTGGTGSCTGSSSSGSGKNAAFFEQLHDNATWRMSEWLQEKPFLSLNPTQKAAILAFLCNELLQNKAVLRQVDGSLETVAQLRKDRWLLDTKLRKLKMIQARKLRQAALQCTPNKNLSDGACGGGVASSASTPASHHGAAEESASESGDKASDKAGDKVTPGKDTAAEPDADEDNEDEADEAESGNESEGTQPEEEEDKNLSVEELHRKLERLSRQSEAALQSLANSAQQLRATCFGQDRFWRRYWALPCAGGVFVEAMESAEPEEHRLAEQADLEPPKPKEEKKEDNKTKDDKEEMEELTSDGENDHRKTPSRDSLPPILKEENGDTKLEEEEEDDDDDEEDDDARPLKQEKMDVEEEELLENGDIERTPAIEEMNGVDSDDAKAKDEEKSDIDEPSSKKIKLEKLQDTSSDLSVMKVEIKSDLFEAELSGCKTEDKSCDDPVSLLANRPVQFERLGECMEKANTAAANGASGDTSNPVIVPNGDKFNALNHLYTLGVFNNGKDLNGGAASSSASCFLLGAGAGGGERNWFSILPRDACDGSSLSNGSVTPSASPFSAGASGAELRIPVFPPPSRLSSPSPSQCDSPAPLILTAEEMVQLEQLKRSGGLPEPGERQPVPLELRRGWWRITDRDQLQTILESLHSRGVRERELKRIVGRFLDHALESCGKQTVLPGCGGEGRGEREHRGSLSGMASTSSAGPGAVDLAITEADSKVSALPGGAPLQDKPSDWSPHVALRVDLQLLEQVEALEDKVANASMQVKGWKVPQRATTEEGVSFRPACVPLDGPNDTRKDPVALAKERLLSLEAAIERRYLRPPLGISTGDVTLPGLNASTSGSGSGDGNSGGNSGCGSSASGSSAGATSAGGSGSSMPCIGNLGPEADLPKGLVVWRDAVTRARTSAQLAMALYSLEASVAWDKSIMKANCQFCHSGDNEDKLLLCDGCDKGYHTYCFRPKMEQIPDGDWYCFECMNKATGERNCIVCGKRRNLVVCEACPRAYHTDCLQPALAKVPRGKWFCSGCATRAPRRRGGGGSGSGRKPRGSATPSTSHANTEKASERAEKHRDSESSDHAAPTRSYLSALEIIENIFVNPLLWFLSHLTKAKIVIDLFKKRVKLLIFTIPPNTSSGDDHTQGAPGTPGASPSPHTSGSASGRKDRGKDSGSSSSTPTGSSSSGGQSTGSSSGMSKKLARDLNPCKALLEDLEAHDEAWPFLLPVNTKQFPTYRKIIRSPMDLSTIKRKLQDAVYKSREEFCADVRLIFNNCETFNEDDSPVGKAGHSMRSFFETRWSEINGTHAKPSTSSSSSA